MEKCFLRWELAFHLLYELTGSMSRVSVHLIHAQCDSELRSLSLAFFFRIIDRVGIIPFYMKKENSRSHISFKFIEKPIQLDFVRLRMQGRQPRSLLSRVLRGRTICFYSEAL